MSDGDEVNEVNKVNVEEGSTSEPSVEVSEEAPKDEEKLLALREGANEVINISRTCSLKTLVKVLGKWSCGEFKKIEFIHLLKEGSGVDENLDDFEKVVDIIQLWLKTGSDFKNNNYFLKLDEYTFVKESRNLDPEKKKQLLKELIEFLI